MNKSDLINAIADSADLSKADAGRALEATIDAITGSLKANDSVSLVGFGTFLVRERAARSGRNLRLVLRFRYQQRKYPLLRQVKALRTR